MLLPENPTDTFYQYLEYYLNITFLPNFYWQKLKYKVLYESP